MPADPDPQFTDSESPYVDAVLADDREENPEASAEEGDQGSAGLADVFADRVDQHISDMLGDDFADAEGDGEEEIPERSIGDFARESEARQDRGRRIMDRHPAVLSKAFEAEAMPLLEEIAEVYGAEVANDPDTVLELYVELGGDQRFAGEFEDQQAIDAMLNAGAAPSTFD